MSVSTACAGVLVNALCFARSTTVRLLEQTAVPCPPCERCPHSWSAGEHMLPGSACATMWLNFCCRSWETPLWTGFKFYLQRLQLHIWSCMTHSEKRKAYASQKAACMKERVPN
eukprot:438068-Pelagomonas_calceolata.AAC.2